MLTIHDTPPSEYLCPKRTRKKGVLTALTDRFFVVSQGWRIRLEFDHCFLARDCAHGSAPICAGKGGFTGAAFIEDDD